MTCMKIDPFYHLEYEKKDGILQQKNDKLAPIKNTLIYKHIISDLIYPNTSQQKRFELLKLYLKEMKRELNDKYPNIKFVFLIYNKNYKLDNISNLKFTDKMLEEIKRLDIDVVDLEDFFGNKLYEDKYRYVGHHPSTQAWQEIVPKLIEFERI